MLVFYKISMPPKTIFSEAAAKIALSGLKKKLLVKKLFNWLAQAHHFTKLTEIFLVKSNMFTT